MSTTINTMTKSKTFHSALHELKSGEAAIDVKCRNHGLSKLQIRRKASKMEDISCLFETKTGIKISLDESGTVARSALSKTLNGDGVEYRASSSVRTKHGHQKAIKSNKVFIIENSQDTGLGNLFGMDGKGRKREGRSSVSTLTGSYSATPAILGTQSDIENEDEKRKRWQDREPSLTQELSSSLIINIKLENKNKYKNDKNFRSDLSTPNGNSSSRSISMNEAFGTFNKLENLLSASPGKNKKILPLHPQDLEKLNLFRKNKKLLLEKVGLQIF